MPPRRSKHLPRYDELTGRHVVDTGTASIVPTSSNGGTWLVAVNGIMSSSIHPDNPERLDFEYMQWIGAVVDELAPPGVPLRVVHIGGAGCTLPLYVSATRPTSRQHVFEVDGALVTLARQAFGLRRVRGLRITTADGREGLNRLADDSIDVVIRDAFTGDMVPPHLTTVEFMNEVKRVLRPTGTYIANVADTAQVRHSRVESAVALEMFAHVSLIAEPAQMRKRRFGNVVLSASGVRLPDDALVRRLAGGMVRARYVETDVVRDMISGVRPVRDADLELPSDSSREPDSSGARSAHASE